MYREKPMHKAFLRVKTAEFLSPAPSTMSGSKALVVDANPSSRSILKGMLIDLGIRSEDIKQVTSYTDARGELEYRNYDIVLCDYHFTDTNQTGPDLLDELRRNNRLPYSTICIMVTSEASQAKVAEAAESALDNYLLKPHNHNNLAERLRVARHRKVVLADIFRAMEAEDFNTAANLCQARFNARDEYWVFAARIGGELLLRLNRHDDARVMFEALDATKALPWARLGIARAQLEGGQLTPCKRTLESLITDNPGYADAYDVMGRAHFQSGDFEQAFETYQRALSLTPSSLSRLQKMGMLAFYLGRTDEAMQALERAASLGGTSSMFDQQSTVMLALLQFSKNDNKALQKSLNLLMKAHESAPRSARLRRMYELVNILMLMQQKQIAEAVRRVKNMPREFTMPDYDFEAAGNMMSLLLQLRAFELDLPDAEIWIERLAKRYCISKAMTDMLCLPLSANPPYQDVIRGTYKAFGATAERALSQAKAGAATEAVASLLRDATATCNAKLMDLADMLIQRYSDKITDPSLEVSVLALRNKYARRAPAGAQQAPR
jgi:CheY-like chemotaxis protein/Tfp pilus assembly protein PilF